MLKSLKYFKSYLYIAYIKNMMERQRHTSDIEHPMYEIIDNALSAVES